MNSALLTHLSHDRRLLAPGQLGSKSPLPIIPGTRWRRAPSKLHAQVFGLQMFAFTSISITAPRIFCQGISAAESARVS